MSLLLGIETATIAVSLAIVRDGTVLEAFVHAGAKSQTEVLHPALVRLFAATGLVPGDLDGIVVDSGPGRFTGVRVGVAAAKGLAFGAGVPVEGRASTTIVLEGVRELAVRVVAAVDLRRGEVAVSFSDVPGEVVRMTPGVLGSLVAERGWTDALVVGDGGWEYRDAIAAGAGDELRFGGPDLAAPSAVAACRLIERTAGRVVGDAVDLAVSYLRGADVRLGWATRDGSVAPTRMEVG